MSAEYQRVLNQAIAEISLAKRDGPASSVAALKQAKYLVNLALDDAQRQAAMASGQEPLTAANFCAVPT